MKQLMPESPDSRAGVGDAVPEQEHPAAVCHPGGDSPVILGSAPQIDFINTVPNDDGNLVAKLGQALLNYLGSAD